MENLIACLTNKKALGILIFVGFVVFINGLFNDFVGDDLTHIVHNENTRISNIPEFFVQSIHYSGTAPQLGEDYYRPLTKTWFAILASLYGDSPFIFHIFQIAFFILNSYLLFLVLRHFVSITAALAVSLLFLIHPVNSEVVFYISNIQEILFFLFGILAILLLMNIEKMQLHKALGISSLLILLSMLSKETAILFVPVTLIYMFLYRKDKLIPYLPYLTGAVFVYFILRINAVGMYSGSIQMAPIASHDLYNRLRNIPSMFFFYLKSSVFPLDLAVSYQWVHIQINAVNFWLPLIAIITFMGSVVAGGIYIYRRNRSLLRNYLLFAAWFMLGIGFHMQIFPLDATVADRWFYFPAVGLLGMFAVVIDINRWKGKWVIVLFMIILGLFSTRTIARSFDWRDNFTIAHHDLKVSPEAYNLENQLSASYFFAGKYKEAKYHAERSIAIYPFANNYNNLGAAQYGLGEGEEARRSFMTAIELGNYYLAYKNLVNMSLKYGDPIENIKYIKSTVITKYPNDANFWIILAILEYREGNVPEARLAAQRAHNINPSPEVVRIHTIIMNNKGKL